MSALPHSSPHVTGPRWALTWWHESGRCRLAYFFIPHLPCFINRAYKDFGNTNLWLSWLFLSRVKFNRTSDYLQVFTLRWFLFKQNTNPCICYTACQNNPSQMFHYLSPLGNLWKGGFISSLWSGPFFRDVQFFVDIPSFSTPPFPENIAHNRKLWCIKSKNSKPKAHSM